MFPRFGFPMVRRQTSSREAVAVFKDLRALEEAAESLESSGFDRAELSMLAPQSFVRARNGVPYRSIHQATEDPGAPHTAYVSKIDITQGQAAVFGGFVFVGGVVAAGIGAGSGNTVLTIVALALLGIAAGMFPAALIIRWLRKRRARHLRDLKSLGGAPLFVRVANAAKERKALNILNQAGGSKVHVREKLATRPA